MFDLKDVLNTAAPTASLIFASWLFLQLVSSRYEATIVRYERAMEELRGECPPPRRDTVLAVARLHGRRFHHMERAMSLGLLAATFLVSSLGMASFQLMTGATWLNFTTMGALITGLVLLVVCALLTMAENGLGRRTLLLERADVPELGAPERARRRRGPRMDGASGHREGTGDACAPP
jgi:hypothetical protein